MTDTEALERRIDELCAENERLRGQVASLIGRSFRTADKIDWLNTENTKLRGLVRDVNKAAHMLCEAWEGSCSKEAEGMSLHAVCPIGDTSELCVFGKLHYRMRELGIEVDDA